MNFKEMSNEELVFYIQEHPEDQQAWSELWIKTKDTVYYVYHNKVHEYYKINMLEDVMSALNMGWFSAVKSYNREKATGKFHCFAIFVINQKYHQFLRKIKPERIGKSVRTEFFQDLKLPVKPDLYDTNIDFFITNLLNDGSASDDYEQLELKCYVDNIMQQLKAVAPDSYNYICEVIYNNKPYTVISKEYNISKDKVSRAVRSGYEYLRQICANDRNDNII